ncbi:MULTISPECIES: aldo/keto reductase [unclassified Rathayibacter]|uniref:aldo/keto reductase n=1 Tax=unclassified Rathayibacter TaxID=2609250 RepID=UPI00105023BE|nr:MULTISPECIES: aldo/keto reductase [unclassified Rathayibacter]TCL79476.1 D-threo-aldose 1-dehydrogenase [Rathayibacter sp. PhB192]TCM25255.1 D-threo-aldose 1-dehydrogenase [Rathayibacter sp. PhB179]
MKDVVAALDLGALAFGGAQLGNLYRETNDAEAVGALARAHERRIRTYDTAPHYGLGLSERRLGEALVKWNRDTFVVSTKVGRILDPVENPSGALDDEGFAVTATAVRRRDYSRDGVLRSIESSLERLQLDHLDVVYVHDPDDHVEETLDAALPTLIELREQGVIRAVGVGMNQSAAPARFVRESDLDLVMVAGRYTLLDQSALADLLPAAQERGVGIIAAGVYNSGLLSKPRPTPESRYDYAAPPEALIRRANAIAEVCERHGSSLPEAAALFPLTHPAVASVVLGMRTADQVDSNVERFASHPPADLWTELIELGLLNPSTPISSRPAPTLERHSA